MTKTSGQQDLENTYNLASPEDNVAYYRGFAPSYDTGFVQEMGYRYPMAIAEAYRRQATALDVPVADIGCGTGIVASELGLAPDQIDGMDISSEMLTLARQKNLYGRLFEVDLTGDLSAIENGYGAVVSAGTFTFGHLGPAPLRGLLRIARSGALFIAGVNRAHFEKEHFAETLDGMTKRREIGPVAIEDIAIYDKRGHAHSDDRALLLQFRRV